MKMMEQRQTWDSPLGRLLLTADGGGLTGVRFWEGPALAGQGQPILEQTVCWLECYFSGREPEFLPPLHLQGTAFRQRVWALLRQIPYGETASYGQLARQLTGSAGAAQAVGRAVGCNPIAILVPCHRVIGADGSLTGYAWGLERKEKLLRLEQQGKGKSPHPAG